MTAIHEVNKRIVDELKKCEIEENQKAFLLDILDFELQHFEERVGKSKVRFRDEYERILNKYCD